MRASLTGRTSLPPPSNRTLGAERAQPGYRHAVQLPPPRPAANADPARVSVIDAILLKSGLGEGLRAARIPIAHLSLLPQIRAERTRLEKLPDEALAPRMSAIRASSAKGPALAEAVALISEALRRAIGVEPYDVQLLAALTLYDAKGSAKGAAVELDTGEGKTFVVAIAAALRALEGQGCHVVTANSTLAARDAAKLAPALAMLGLSIAVTRELSLQSRAEKRVAYAADITYGTAETLGFDFLIDELAAHPSDRVQRGHHAVLVDEADHVLIDSAQSPLLLSGDADSSDLHAAKVAEIELAGRLARSLEPGSHFEILERGGARVAQLTEAGTAFLAAEAGASNGAFDLWSPRNASLVHCVHQALTARCSFAAGHDYLTHEGKVVIVDQGTGHTKPDSTWSDGLHEAIAEKEGLPIQAATRFLAEITVQSYFGRYRHLSGITGTAAEAEDELASVYGIKVIDVPRHLRSRRVDAEDLFFVHPALRDLAAIDALAAAHEAGRPVLVSTVSVAAAQRISERLAEPRLLYADVALSSPALIDAVRDAFDAVGGQLDPVEITSAGALVEALRRHPHALVAFARFLADRGLATPNLWRHLAGLSHQHVSAATGAAEELEILGTAGRPGAITVGTQKLGRGVDIKLEGTAEQNGGLLQLGIERQTSRRKDRQVRGRAGRNGDRGSSRFFVSLGDEVFGQLPAETLRKLCRLFPEDRVDQPRPALRHIMEKAVAQAQETHELEAAAARRQLVGLDQVIQTQRHAVSSRRDELLLLTDDALIERLEDWLVARIDRDLLLRARLPAGAADLDAIIEAHRDRPPFMPPTVLGAVLDRIGLASIEEDALVSVGDIERAIAARLIGLPPGCTWAAGVLSRQVMGDHLYRGTRPVALDDAEVEETLALALEAGRRVSRSLVHSVLAGLGSPSDAAKLPPRALGIAEALEWIDAAITTATEGSSEADEAARTMLWSASRAVLAEPYAELVRAPLGDAPSEHGYHRAYLEPMLRGLGASPRSLPERSSLDEARQAVRHAFQARIAAADAQVGRAVIAARLRSEALGAIDRAWAEYQSAVPDLKEGALLAVYRQRSPKVELAQRAALAMKELEAEVISEAVSGALSALSTATSTVGAKR